MAGAANDHGSVRRSESAVTLEMLKVGITNMISTELVGQRGGDVGSFTRDSITLDVRMADFIRQQLALELRAYVLAEKKDVNTEISRLLVLEVKVPASPWHHFRHNHRDAWWLRWIRRPIRYTTHRKTGELHASLTRYLTYPQADIAFPGLGTPVRMWTTTGRIVEW